MYQTVWFDSYPSFWLNYSYVRRSHCQIEADSIISSRVASGVNTLSELEVCIHALVWADVTRGHLQVSYDGPYKVLRSGKHEAQIGDKLNIAETLWIQLGAERCGGTRLDSKQSIWDGMRVQINEKTTYFSVSLGAFGLAWAIEPSLMTHIMNMAISNKNLRVETKEIQ